MYVCIFMKLHDLCVVAKIFSCWHIVLAGETRAGNASFVAWKLANYFFRHGSAKREIFKSIGKKWRKVFIWSCSKCLLQFHNELLVSLPYFVWIVHNLKWCVSHSTFILRELSVLDYGINIVHVLNPLTSMSEQDRVSPYNINIMLTR